VATDENTDAEKLRKTRGRGLTVVVIGDVEELPRSDNRRENRIVHRLLSVARAAVVRQLVARPSIPDRVLGRPQLGLHVGVLAVRVGRERGGEEDTGLDKVGVAKCAGRYGTARGGLGGGKRWSGKALVGGREQCSGLFIDGWAPTCYIRR
jgi:hypothetical protein